MADPYGDARRPDQRARPHRRRLHLAPYAVGHPQADHPQADRLDWHSHALTEAWANVKACSIYNALHRMNREGLVETITTEQADGPARTVFGLTDTGRTALSAQIRRSLARHSFALDGTPWPTASRCTRRR